METKVFIPSSKGKLAAIITEASSKANKLAILCPGFLDSKDYAHLVALATDLANTGYTVVRFDPTGTWESEGVLDDYSTTQYLIDVKKVLEYMQGQNSYTEILLGGHSKGGYIAMLYAISDPQISTVLAIMSPYSLNRLSNQEIIAKWYETGYRTSKRDVPNTDEIIEFKVGLAYVEDRFGHEVLSKINQFHGNLFLLSGEQDQTVLSEDVEKVYTEANEPKYYHVMPGMGHDYRKHPDQIQAVNAQILIAIQKFIT